MTITDQITALLSADPACNGRVMGETVRAIAEVVAGKRWASVPKLVDQITSEEGATVTFTGSNPDFNGLPNEVVTVMQGPDWTETAYRGDTLADCLKQAIERGDFGAGEG